MWPLSWSSKGAVFVFAEIIWIEKKNKCVGFTPDFERRVLWVGESRIPHTEFSCLLRLVLIYLWSSKVWRVPDERHAISVALCLSSGGRRARPLKRKKRDVYLSA